ncbi:MAG: hypothetical protein IJ454_04770, partial [Clostridia bacterium]|nr:hypothetical protein [Clostridia bacterium]
MKTIRKTLSLLLTICMLMSMVCISYADETPTEVTLPEKLLDLNLDNFAATTTAGSSGITNSGTSTTAQINLYGGSNITEKKDYFVNAQGNELPYIHMTHSKYNWDGVGAKGGITDTA